ncbi:protein 5NUC-like isoform X1 [Dermacentor andersoni]|uniref:protein 5NUC-like isoform X1 n=1 Tax=Dermacentor andersoni TaxID=34620 RepID=UPI0021553384|nr:protein 5NUC-like isoform X1 [Dermacentor andersoni]
MNTLAACLLLLPQALQAAHFSATVLHTNDVHGRFEQVTPSGTRCTKQASEAHQCVGGIARQKTLVMRAKASGANVLFLNSGDYYQGSIWYYFLGAQIVVDAVNYLAHDAMTLGNHEFDHGADGLAPLLTGSQVPILACNVDFTEEPQLRQLQPRAALTVERAGTKIGLIGYLTPNTTFLSNPGRVRFTDEVECIRREAQRLRREEGVHVIIAMGHSGVPRDVEICERVPEVSLVVGGHTHTFLYSGPTADGGLVSGDKPQGPYPIVVDRVSGSRCLVVQDFYMGKYMGNISVTWDDRGEVVRWSGQPTLLDSSVPEDSAGVALLDRYRDRVAQGRAMGVAESKVYLQGDKPTCRLAECNLGNLIMDAFLKKMASLPSPRGAWTSVAAVIANAGGIRASIDEQSTGGLVTFEDVVNVLPFGNTLVVMNVSGAQLRNLLEHGVHRHDAKGEVPPAEFLITAGLRVVYDVRRKPYERVVDAFILCADCRVPRFEPLEDARRYRVAAMSYIVRGGDNFNFSFVAPSDMYDTGFEDAQIVVSHMNATSPLTTAIDGRVTFLKLPTGQTSASDGRSAPALASHVACLLLFVIFTCSMTFSAQ